VKLFLAWVFFFLCLLYLERSRESFADEPAGAIKWEQSLEKALERAKKENRPVLAVFTTKTGSQGSDMFRSETLQDSKVIQFVNERFIAVELISENLMNRAHFEKYGVKYGVTSVPITVILKADGAEMGRIFGFRPPADFIESATEILDADKNIADADAAIAKDPNNAQGYLKKGRALLAKGKEEGRAALEKAAELDQNNEKGSGARAHYALAELALSRGDQEEAKKHLEKVAEIDLKNASGKTVHAFFLLGQLALDTRERAKAADYFKKAKEVDPEDKSGLLDDIDYTEARIPLLERKWLELEAADNLVKFASKYPKSALAPRALYEAAALYYGQKYVEKAISALEQIVKGHPQSQFAKEAGMRLEQLKKR
jgi:thioredoxin-related protein